jgi:hypothetical protein
VAFEFEALENLFKLASLAKRKGIVLPPCGFLIPPIKS